MAVFESQTGQSMFAVFHFEIPDTKDVFKHPTRVLIIRTAFFFF